MTNFALPLVIITWHTMLGEYFWEKYDKTFFDFGDYLERKKNKKAHHIVITCTWRHLMGWKLNL
jgi:hypothetical protein